MTSGSMERYSWLNPSIFKVPDRLTEIPGWHGHIPFAFWVIEAVKPRLFVELGTHKGDSYSAFCQSVSELGIPTICYAVDSWEGDEHSGLYGDEIFVELSAYNQRKFGAFSTLLRMYFEDALAYFDDGTIDLLHIDGYHTYDAVKTDFDKWISKLSSRGVVLFHDIMVREREFGVWKFWDEIKTRYPSIEFTHSNGLGVLAIGKEVPPVLADLISCYQKSPSDVLSVFQSLGARCQLIGDKDRMKAEQRDLHARLIGEQRELEVRLSAEQNLNAEAKRLYDELVDEMYFVTSDLAEHKVLADHLTEENKRLRASLVREEELNYSVSMQIERAVEDRDEVLNSETWRLTAPLRYSLISIKRLMGWRRFYATTNPTLKPLQGVASSALNGKSIALSGKVRYSIEPPLPMPGWYQLEVDIEATAPTENLRGYVIAETINSDRYSQQIPSRRVGQRLEIQFHFNSSITRLELVVMGVTGEFQLGQVSLHPIMKVPNQKIARILGPRVGNVLLSELPAIASEQRLLDDESTYIKWIENSERVDEEYRQDLIDEIASFPKRPLISVVIPSYNTPIDHLVTAIESVRAQIYPEWELCISDDCSSDPEIRSLIERYVAADNRIKAHFREQNGGISANTNDAIALASGEYIAFLDADDEISEFALFYVARELQSSNSLELIYSDEDKITGSGKRFDGYFKPSLSPELLLCKNYINHLTVVRASTMRRLGGLRPAFDGAQDWDLHLRLLNVFENDLSLARRIPRVLYHWRSLPSSTSTGTGVKTYALEAGRNSVKSYLESVVPGSEVVPSSGSQVINRVIFPIPDSNPLVSILITTAGGYSVVRACLDSLFGKTTYSNYEVILRVDSNVAPSRRTTMYLDSLSAKFPFSYHVSVRHDNAGFNYSVAVNELARRSSGELLVFLNDDTEIIEGEWLSEMVSVLSVPGIGVVGAHLLYPNGLIQHGGVLIGMGGVAGHLYHLHKDGSHGYFNDLFALRDVGAVTGACLGVHRDIYLKVGGFNEERLGIAFNDTDFCMKVLSNGYRIVQDPNVRLVHKESITRGYEDTTAKQRRFDAEKDYLRTTWKHYIEDDPFYNPNLSRNGTFEIEAVSRVREMENKSKKKYRVGANRSVNLHLA